MDVAIIGHAFNLPGARTIEQFAQLIYAGEDAFSRSGSVNPDAEHWVDSGGFIEQHKAFDYKAFGLSYRDSVIIEPQQRLFIQHCWLALEHAGYNPEQVGTEVGVFSASSDSDYIAYLRESELALDKYDPFELEIGANKEQQSLRTSFLLNLTGPSLAVQSACSSGLLTVHSAILALANGDCGVALAGGSCLPYPLIQGYNQRPGMNWSEQGKICAFDATADGMVAGFGTIVFVLKPYTDAVADKDTIYGVIKGTTVNNDGRYKSGYTAPSTKSMVKNLKHLFTKFGCPASNIDFVEAHGSGTKIGDVLEAAALNNVFKDPAATANTVALSSVKSAIGHLDVAAGHAGLLRAMLQVWQGKIAPAANFSSLNPSISFKGTPLYIPTKDMLSQTEQPTCTTGLVNSLGIGGTNCALLISAHSQVQNNTAISVDTQQEVYLGAANEARLKAYIQQLSEELSQTELNFADVAFTLSRRAQGKAFTIAVPASSCDELVAQLQTLLNSPLGSCQIPTSLSRFAGQAVLLQSSELDSAVIVEVKPKAQAQSQAQAQPIAQKLAPQPVAANRSTAALDKPAIEAVLAEIWCDNLMVDSVNSDTSFLAEGGHSMMALTVIDDIKAQLEVDLALEWVEQHDTFAEQLVALYAKLQAGEQKQSYLRTLKPASAQLKARIILVHASISGAEAYKSLAAEFADNIEVLAIDSYNLYANEDQIIDDMNAMVQLYSDDILSQVVDIQTPIIIGGWSLGGMTANLIAQRLKGKLPIKAQFALDSVVYSSQFKGLFSDDNLKYFMDVENLFAKAAPNQNNRNRRLLKVFKAERKMAVAFKPMPLQLPMLNIVATKAKNPIDHEPLQREFDQAKRDNGWQVAGPIRFEFIPTDHEGIVDSNNACVVAAMINQCIEDHV